jgi:NTP pyrophosphatase (non-canonical NTP hydrolase)
MRDNIFNIDTYADTANELWFSHPGINIRQTAFQERDLSIASFGLAGETGEVMELLKKRVRDGVLDIDKLEKELGDVIYYWVMLCRQFGLTPSKVLATNIQKIEDRRARGVLRGSGSDR